MANHYTRQRQQTKRQSHAPRQLIIAIAAFIAGYFMASVVDYANLTAWVNKQFAAKQSVKKTKAAVKPELPKPKLEFYTLLAKDTPAINPSMVSLDPLTKKSAAQAQLITTQQTSTQSVSNESYIIQLAAFSKNQEAEQLKASLTLKGFNVKIATVLQQNTNWFKVIIGPYATRTEAEKVQTKLIHEEHLKGIIRQMER